MDTAIYSLMITIMFYMDNFRYDAKRIGYLWGNNLMNRFLRGNLKPKTLFSTFHHSSSRINAIFGDECDELIMTARFKSLKVTVVLADSQIGCG